MKKELAEAIAALPGGSNLPPKYKVEPLDVPPSVAVPARIDGTYAEDLAAKIKLAFLQYGRAPDSAVVAKELQNIADLSRALHRALSRATSPAVQHIANAYGGLGQFRVVRRDLFAMLDTLHRATNQPDKTSRGKPKAKRGAKPDLYAKAVADAAAATYQEVTGHKSTRVTNPDTYAPRGTFHGFLTAVFAAAHVDGEATTHVERLTKGRRRG